MNETTMCIRRADAKTEVVILWTHACRKQKSWRNQSCWVWLGEKKRKRQTMYVLDGWDKGCNQAVSARALGSSAG